MPTLVEQIQYDAMDQSVPVNALLRRVKFTAAKLGLGRVEVWVEQELNGYTSGELPDYRILSGQPMAFNPYRGWQQIGGHVEQISKRGTVQSIAEIEDMLGRDGGGDFQIAYSDKLQAKLNKMNGVGGWSYALQVDRAAMAGIPDRVRTLVLDWALELERAGIMGNEFSFNADEKQKAQDASVTNIHIGSIGNFTGVVGSGNTAGDINSTVINTDQVKSMINQLRTYKDAIVNDGVDEATLDRVLSSLKTETEKATPDQGMLRGFLTDLRSAIAGAAGNLIVSGAMGVINQLLGTGVPTA